MKNYEEEIKKAKEEVIHENIVAWKREYANKHNLGTWSFAPEPPLKDVTPKSWFIANWGTGFLVADLQKVMKLPKRQREKIFSLGGLVNG